MTSPLATTFDCPNTRRNKRDYAALNGYGHLAEDIPFPQARKQTTARTRLRQNPRQPEPNSTRTRIIRTQPSQVGPHLCIIYIVTVYILGYLTYNSKVTEYRQRLYRRICPLIQHIRTWARNPYNPKS